MTNLRFHEDDSFRVLQMADAQDGLNVFPDTIRLIHETIRKAGPDLAMFAGDQVRGYGPAYIDTSLHRHDGEPGTRVHTITGVEAELHGIKRRTRNHVSNRLLAMESDGNNPDTQQVASTISTTSALVYSATSDPQDAPTTLGELMDETCDKVHRTFTGFLDPIIGAEMPFAATYSNHDFQCGILANEQNDIYHEFPDCLDPVNSLGPGTFALSIETSDGPGRVAMSAMMVNSSGYAGKPEENDAQYPAYVVSPRGLDLANSDGYGTSSPEAIDWLGTVQSELGKRNGDGRPVPTITFQYIPPQGFYDCLKEIPAWTLNAVEGARAHTGHYYVFNHKIYRPGSRLGEAIGCADENVDEVGALCKADGYFVLFYGHDHKNAFMGHAHGTDLGYAPICGFECYDPKSRCRGIHLLEFHESNPASYMIHVLAWGDLVGRYSSNEMHVWFENHCMADAVSIRNELHRPQVFAALAGAMNLGFMAIIRPLMRKQ